MPLHAFRNVLMEAVMKLSQATRINLAARKEQRDIEALEKAGYFQHGVTLSGTETIQDVKVAKDGKSIWIKTASE